MFIYNNIIFAPLLKKLRSRHSEETSSDDGNINANERSPLLSGNNNTAEA